MKRKTFELIETKADGEPGHFSALASVFGNVDHVGDRVMPGAFKATLKRWRESGDPIPIVLSHQWDNPMAHIGIADPRAVIETEKGLLVQGKLDIEDNETAKQVYRLMKRRSLTGWSFGYTVPDGGERLNEEDGANELTEVDLVENGPTLKGANSEAQLQAVKSALDVEAPPKEHTRVAEIPVSDGALENPPRVVDEVHSHNASTGVDATVTVDGTVPVFDFTTGTSAEPPKLTVEEPPAEAPGEEKSLPEEVENVESEGPVEPVKPAAKDALKNEIDLLRLEIAVGKPLRR